MLKRLYRAVSIAAFGVAIAGVSHSSAIVAAGARSISDEPLQETTLHLPGVEPGTKVVAAALADIDADGDLDLVASDGTLDLLVWSNDGSGHFTRKYPTQGPSGGWFSPDASLESGSGTPPASVVPGGSASLVTAARLTRALDPAEWRVGSADSSPRPRTDLTRGSRAPPHALRSA
ncbi:MAG TPA: hypothetical protein VH138_15745 [Vicinamibacterales bacterium]|nr:hypothetical protein [Vicinamibacterales bacterium]